jgi:hypothetical protein
MMIRCQEIMVYWYELDCIYLKKSGATKKEQSS